MTHGITSIIIHHLWSKGITSIILGVIASGASLALFLTPVPFFWRIWKKKTTEQFHPWPYLATYIYCFLCTCYYAFKSHDKFHFPSPALFGMLGMFVVSLYGIIFFCFTTQRNQVILGWFFVFQALVYIFSLSLLLAGSPLPFIFGNRTSDIEGKLYSILGFMTHVSGIIMYGSPFSNIITVYRTKSLKYMPSGLCMAMFLNSFSWFICAITDQSFDLYITIVNGIGMLLGLVQLKVLHMFYLMPQKSNTIVNCVEATFDVDHTEEITVLDTFCARCKFHSFELDEKIKITSSTEYVLSKDEDGNSWIAREAETALVDESESGSKPLPFLEFLQDGQTLWVIWKSWIFW